MTNKITLPRELAERIEHLLLDAFGGTQAGTELRAALAEPVPPAGGEPVAWQYRIVEEGEPLFHPLNKNGWFTTVEGVAKEMAERPSLSKSRRYEVRELVDRAHVTRLQAELTSAKADKEAYAQNAIGLRAEVERLHGRVREEQTYVSELAAEHTALQSELTDLKLEVESWKSTAETFEDFYRKTEEELTKARELLDEVVEAFQYGIEGNGSCRNPGIAFIRPWTKKLEALSNQSAPADKEECTSCDGSGEFIDAIGDWRGYCSCPAGVELKNRSAPADKVHGDPVAWADPLAFSNFKAHAHRGGPYDHEWMWAKPAHAGMIPLYLHAEQSAPVAVVMPEFDQAAALEALSRQIYNSWESQPGFHPWVNGGNSLKQDEARHIARRTFELAMANQGKE